MKQSFTDSMKGGSFSQEKATGGGSFDLLMVKSY